MIQSFSAEIIIIIANFPVVTANNVDKIVCILLI